MLPEQPERSLDGGTKPGTSLSKILMGVPVPKQKGFVLPKSDKPMPSINGRFVFMRTFGKRPPGFCNRATGEAAHHCKI